MNTLSWFLYLADVLPSLGCTLSFITTVILLILFIYSIHNSTENKNHKYWKYLSIPIFILIFSNFIPSKNTMYAIAASEIGEEAIKSKLGQKITTALEKWIDTQLEDSTKGTK